MYSRWCEVFRFDSYIRSTRIPSAATAWLVCTSVPPTSGWCGRNTWNCPHKLRVQSFCPDLRNEINNVKFLRENVFFFFNYINSSRTKGRGHWMTTTMVPSDFQRTDIRFNPNEWMYRIMMKFQFHVLREHVQWPSCEQKKKIDKSIFSPS